jgi:hypothetical protein
MALPPLFTAAAHSTSQLSEFVATMVYVIWHARKTAKLPDYQSVRNNTDLAYLMWQARKPVTKAAYSPLEHSLSSYTASPAFKKFCFQVIT